MMAAARCTAGATSAWKSAPELPWTQWSGHSICGPYSTSIWVNGAAPSWLEAKLIWSGVCQSCDTTTVLNRAAISLISGMIDAPP